MRKKIKKSLIFGVIIILSLFLIGVGYYFIVGFKQSVLDAGITNLKGSCSNFVEDNEKISFSINLNGESSMTDCNEKISGGIDTGYIDVMTCGDYDSGHRKDLFDNRVYSSYECVVTTPHLIGLEAITNTCSGSPTIPTQAKVSNEKVSCKIVDQSPSGNYALCRYTSDVSSNLPSVFGGSSLIISANVECYKAGYYPTLTYYRYSNNECKTIQLKSTEKTADDFIYLSDCEKEIINPTIENEDIPAGSVDTENGEVPSPSLVEKSSFQKFIDAIINFIKSIFGIK